MANSSALALDWIRDRSGSGMDRRQRPAAPVIGMVLRARRCNVRSMDIDGAGTPPHLPVEDQAWAAAIEISGDEAWLTTEPQLGLDGEPEG